MLSFLDDINKLPAGNIFLYGAGGVAQQIAGELQAVPQKWTFKGFLTSFPADVDHQNQIYHFDTVRADLRADDNILIVNQHSRELWNKLSHCDIPARVFDGILLVFPWCNYEEFSCPTSLEERTGKIIDKLGSERSKTIYNFLADTRNPKETQNIAIHIHNFYRLMDEHYGPESACFDKHYFDYNIFDDFEVVIEGGANLGLITQKILNNIPETGKVYSFEPFHEQIKSTFAKHPIHRKLGQEKATGRYIVESLALWSQNKELSFTGEGSDFASYRATTKGDGIKQVPAVSIDKYCSINNISSVDFIKLDVEGAEPAVLAGASEQIKKHKPAMAISIYHGASQFWDIPEYLISNYPDYRFEIGHHSNSPWLETVLYCIPKNNGSNKLPED